MIAIINYKAGNLTSVERALHHLDLNCCITDDANVILSAERVIFPGVGAAGKAMEIITTSALDAAIHTVISRGTPFMGICLGTQIILESSQEDDGTLCLGVIPGTVKRFPGMGLKIPHMGWNSLSLQMKHPLMQGVDPSAQFYFVHSYYPEPADKANIVAHTSYGIDFASVMAKQNVFATQFHPEKSGPQGLKILKNFSTWNGQI